MSTTTTNLGLVKPGYNDAADIADINNNMDIIDDAYADQNTSIAGKEPILAKGSLIGTSSDTVDLDDYKDTGYYFVTVNDYTYNAPVLAGNYGYFEVMKMNTGITLQRFTLFGNNNTITAANTYVRYYTNSQWYNWKLVSANTASLENMIWGGDDIRFRTDSGDLSDDLPYPISKASSTFTGSKSCLRYNRNGLRWTDDSSIASETGKYTVFNLGYVPNLYPFTVTFYFKGGSYYFDAVSATVTSDTGDFRVDRSDLHAGCIRTTFSANENYKTLQWVVGHGTNSDAYDAPYIYDMASMYVVAIRCEQGSRQYTNQEMKSMLSAKESLYDRYLSEKITTESANVLTKGDLNSGDLDNYTTNGLYFVTIGENVSHAPVSMGNFGYLEVWKMSNDALMQRFTLFETNGLNQAGATFLRYKNLDTWYDWVRPNDNLAQNIIFGGDDLSLRYSDSTVHTYPIYPIEDLDTTYSNMAYPLAADNKGFLWFSSNTTIYEERNKYATYKLCDVNGTYPIAVSILLKNGNNYVTRTATAIVTDANNNFPIMYGTHRVGYLHVVDGELRWYIGRSVLGNGEIYDAEGLYQYGADGRIVAIHCEYGNRVYNKDEMVRMLSQKENQIIQYVDQRINQVLDSINGTGT